MNKLCLFAGTMVGGSGFGWLAPRAGLGFGWTAVVSGVGSLAGVWAGWKIAQRYPERPGAVSYNT